MGRQSSIWRDKSLEPKRFSAKEKFTIPLYERLADLWIFGYTHPAIVEILRSEFEDIEINPITPDIVEAIIDENRKDLLNRKATMAELCRDEHIASWRDRFDIVMKSEDKMTASLAKKMDSIVEAMEKLDLSEIDEKTQKPVHLPAFYAFLEAYERTQKLLSKMAGTDSFREMELWKIKEKFKKHLEEDDDGLIPKMRDANAGLPKVTG